MKKIFFSLVIFFSFIINVSAFKMPNYIERSDHESIRNKNLTKVCDMGNVYYDGSLTKWPLGFRFTIAYECTKNENGSCTEKSYYWSIFHNNYENDPSDFKVFEMKAGLDTLMNDGGIHFEFPFFTDLKPYDYNNDIYDFSEFQSLIKSGKCPEYVYVANYDSREGDGQAAFIFSASKLDNYLEIFEKNGYKKGYTLPNLDFATNAKKEVEDKYKKMKAAYDKFVEDKLDEVYSKNCVADQEIALWEYEKAKENLISVDVSFDFSNYDNIYKKYKEKQCLSVKDAVDLTNELNCNNLFKNSDGSYNNTWNLLNDVLHFMQYLAVIAALVLSIVDIFKVVISNEKDALKKAIIKAVIRLVIAIIIFFVPLIIDLILDLAGFSDATCGLF